MEKATLNIPAAVADSRIRDFPICLFIHNQHSENH